MAIHRTFFAKHYFSFFFLNNSIGWFVGYDGSIYKYTSEPVTGMNIQKQSNFQLHLYNYPNPFNPSTYIRYYLPRSGYVILRIYNIVGQELETLANGFKEAGEHEITWQAKGLPGGIYFYKLQSGEYTETKKLILQK